MEAHSLRVVVTSCTSGSSVGMTVSFWLHTTRRTLRTKTKKVRIVLTQNNNMSARNCGPAKQRRRSAVTGEGETLGRLNDIFTENIFIFIFLCLFYRVANAFLGEVDVEVLFRLSSAPHWSAICHQRRRAGEGHECEPLVINRILIHL